MSQSRTVYLPLATYPDALPDGPVGHAVRYAAAFGNRLAVTAFSVDLPPVYSPMGGVVMDLSSLVREAEARSAAECKRLEAIVQGAASKGQTIDFVQRQVPGSSLHAAAEEARYADLTVLPWTDDAGPRDLAEAVIFGAGRPVILVPEGKATAETGHLAIAWDGSRVAARALADALPLMAGAKVTVLTVRGEKPVGEGVGARLAAGLAASGWEAAAQDVALDGRPIGVALQEAALAAGAGLLAMGGFGHSRLRDMVLGGATKGVLADLRMPVLLSH